MAGEQLNRRGSGGAGDSRLSMSQQSVLVSKSTKCILGYIKHDTASQSKEVIFPLHLALVQPCLEYGVQF